MSAFMVDDATLQEIVSAALGYGLVSPEGVDQLGRMLALENVRSVSYRYSEGLIGAPAYNHKPCAHNAGQVAKSLTCYLHQSCEHPEWESSEARAVCLRLAVALLDRIPGYDEADWR